MLYDGEKKLKLMEMIFELSCLDIWDTFIPFSVVKMVDDSKIRDAFIRRWDGRLRWEKVTIIYVI